MASPADAAPAVAEPVTPADPVPPGWFDLTPELAVEDVDAAVAFYARALAAEVVDVRKDATGAGEHAEIRIGDSMVMVHRAGQGFPAPRALGGSPVLLMVYTADVDRAFERARQAGAEVTMPLDDQFWGDRYGELVDPYGHRWALASRLEELTDAQMDERAALIAQAMSGPSDRVAEPVDKPRGPGASAEPPPAPDAWKRVSAAPATSPIPTDYHTVTIALSVPDAGRAIAFYEQAFGARTVARMQLPNGKTMHAEVRIGETTLMMADEIPEFGTRSAVSLGGSPVAIQYYVADADAVYARAIEAGATGLTKPYDAAWGDRYAAVAGPSGVRWGLATRPPRLVRP